AHARPSNARRSASCTRPRPRIVASVWATRARRRDAATRARRRDAAPRMTTWQFAAIAVTVLVAGFVQGSTGVGFALIAAPVIGLLAPSLLPVCVLVLM